MKLSAYRCASLSIVLASLALAACNSQGSAAPPKSTSKATSAPTQVVAPEANRLHDDVAWLADDAQEGRRAGTAAGKKSGEWIAARCMLLGLKPVGGPGANERVSIAPTSFEADSKKEPGAKPAGDDDSYEQEFSVPKPVEVGPNSSVQWSGKTEGTATKKDEIVPAFCSGGGSAKGQVDWRAYGLISGEKNWNDYATRCERRVVLIVRGTPPAPKAEAAPASAENPHGGNVEAGDGWGNSGSLFLKVMNAKKNGAVAVLIAPDPKHADEPLPQFDFSSAAHSEIPALFVSASVADRLYPNWRDLVKSTDRSAGLEHEELVAAPIGDAKPIELPKGAQQDIPPLIDVTVSADVQREKGAAYNVLGLLPGANHERVVVVGAHYDHLGFGGEGSLAPNAYGQVHNGADDNASGTATVLEIARVMSKGPQPDCDVLFALWSGEELGLLGSEYWAQHPTIPIEHVVANLNLDMVGRAGNNALEVLGVGSSAPFEAWLKEASSTAQLTLKMNSSGQGIGGSDHQTFLKRKIPALFFFSGVHSDYHKPSDDTERFEADGAQKVAALGVDVVRRMCAAKELAWIEPPAPEAAAPGAPKPGGGFRVWFGTVPEYSFEGPGLLLAGTSSGSPAEKAGMLKGDILMQVGDVEIENIQDFMYALQTYKPGDVVLARFLRDNKEESVRVTLATRDAQ